MSEDEYGDEEVRERTVWTSRPSIVHGTPLPEKGCVAVRT